MYKLEFYFVDHTEVWPKDFTLASLSHRDIGTKADDFKLTKVINMGTLPNL